jgi:hypothetical protein
MHETKTVDFMYYSDSESDSEESEEQRRATGGSYRVSMNFTDCLAGREMGLAGSRFAPCRLTSEYGTRHMLSNAMLKEYPLVLPNMNKGWDAPISGINFDMFSIPVPNSHLFSAWHDFHASC